jgi:hypothetical protein
MGERPCILANAAHVAEVAPCGREEVVAVVVLLLQHAPHEREAVRVHAGRRKADHGVPRPDPRAVHDAIPVDDADAGSREVEFVLLVDPG